MLVSGKTSREQDKENYRKKANVFYREVPYTLNPIWSAVSGATPQVAYWRGAPSNADKLGMIHINGSLTRLSGSCQPMSTETPIMTINIENVERFATTRPYTKYGIIRSLSDISTTGKGATAYNQIIHLVAKLTFVPTTDPTIVNLFYSGTVNQGLWLYSGIEYMTVHVINLDLYL
jgi:hypothetical protein